MYINVKSILEIRFTVYLLTYRYINIIIFISFHINEVLYLYIITYKYLRRYMNLAFHKPYDILFL